MSVKTIRTEVYCLLHVEGTHNWPSCPFDEVAYLQVEHRHLFVIKAYKTVYHSDRDIEFIRLKHSMLDYITAQYYNDDKKLHVFGAKSCEMIGLELIEQFDLSKVDVAEDAENGSVLTVTIYD